MIGSYSPEKKTEVLHSSGNAIERGVSFMQNVRNRMDIYFDHRVPSIVIELEAYKTGYIDIRKRGGKIRSHRNNFGQYSLLQRNNKNS